MAIMLRLMHSLFAALLHRLFERAHDAARDHDGQPTAAIPDRETRAFRPTII